MPSTSRSVLDARLSDVDELISAHRLLTGGGAGAPPIRPGPGKQRQGSAITRAGIVLLSAATEAFVEELFEEAANLIYTTLSNNDRTQLFKNTSRAMNNPSIFKIEMLYLNLGMPMALSSIKWQGRSIVSFRNSFTKLIETRGSIAHGKGPTVHHHDLKQWRTMVEKFAPRFETLVAAHIEERAGARPAW